MAKLITVTKAKQEIKRLQTYIDLVESYEADTLEKVIIKEYAFTNSCIEVTKRLNSGGYQLDNKPIDFNFVKSVITGNPTDPLHKLLKSGFNSRVRASKRHYKAPYSRY
ncbi:hypothetical protein P4361_08055 [Fictibacillus sp. B-59209]|uniref:hypothetical protein n=1 Tax=Fictibacillus sp. B-59209 TaxID=3024873 RepID=UPI002E1FA282|nr:hypothetical protein [Fictibacillus sp. B-59209]